MSKNYYDILEVTKEATKEEIKKAYRRLSKVYHPDMAGADDKEAEEKFKEISEAYEVLSDDAKKHNYDTYGDPKGETFEDLKNQFHGAFNSFRNVVYKGESIAVVISMTLEEIKNGAIKTLAYKKNVTCTICGGNGSKFGTSKTNCSMCLGAGKLHRRFGPFTEEFDCHHCGGNGHFITDPCESCSGNKVIQQDNSMEVNVPPGVIDGWKTKLGGYGHDCQAKNGIPGDLIIIIQQIPHEHFERNGDDLIYKLELSFPDIIFGVKVQVPTLSTNVVFDVPAHTKIGKVFRIQNHGLPSIMHAGHVGDLLVETTVSIPENISEEEKKNLEELRKSNNFISKNTYNN